MSVRSAALFALIAMVLLTVLVLIGFVRDLLVALNGAVPALRVLASLIYLLASVGVTVFFFAFYKAQR